MTTGTLFSIFRERCSLFSFAYAASRIDYRISPDFRNSYASFSRYSADLCLFLLVAKHGQLSRAATEAGISSSNAGVRVFRARQALRKQVARACGTCAEHGCLDCHCQPSRH